MADTEHQTMRHILLMQKERATTLLEDTGAWVLGCLTMAGRAMRLLADTIMVVPHIFTRSVFSQLLRQLARAGFGSMGVLCLITILTGMIIVMAMGVVMEKYGGLEHMGSIMGVAFTRELGPIWAAVIMLAKVGSSMAAELGTMTVNEEVEALQVMDIKPVRFLVLPRILALVISMPLLCAIGDVVGLYGAAFVAENVFSLPVETFFESLRSLLGWQDVVGGLMKSLVFGLAIGVIACDQGLSTEGGAEGVGKATTSTVKLCVIYVLILDLIMNAFMPIPGGF
jgi:phospholipid/cholesterol/gamma-HCH transport system permease protein